MHVFISFWWNQNVEGFPLIPKVLNLPLVLKISARKHKNQVKDSPRREDLKIVPSITWVRSVSPLPLLLGHQMPRPLLVVNGQWRRSDFVVWCFKSLFALWGVGWPKAPEAEGIFLLILLLCICFLGKMKHLKCKKKAAVETQEPSVQLKIFIFVLVWSLWLALQCSWIPLTHCLLLGPSH